MRKMMRALLFATALLAVPVHVSSVERVAFRGEMKAAAEIIPRPLLSALRPLPGLNRLRGGSDIAPTVDSTNKSTDKPAGLLERLRANTSLNPYVS